MKTDTKLGLTDWNRIKNLNLSNSHIQLINFSQDQDECATHPCGDRGECIDLVAEFFCKCFPGYVGNRCETDINVRASYG